MDRTLGRRLLAGLAAVTAAGAFATPAQAAPATVVQLATPPVTVAAGGNTYVNPILFSETEQTLHNGTMVYQISAGLAGVSLHDDPSVGPQCTQNSPTKLTCSADDETDVGPYGTLGNFLVRVDASSAALGQAGKLTATFLADNVAPVSQTVDLTVAEGVDLAAGADKSITLKPGADFSTPLQVHNTTAGTVDGTALVFGTDYGFAATTKFSNCFYDGDLLNACTFDQQLKPGVTYQASVPYRLRPDTYAPSSQAGQFEWLTAGDFDDLLKFAHDNGFDGPGKAGDGPPLTLTALSAARQTQQKQTDQNPENNWQTVSLTIAGNQGTDVAAVGATVTGKAGDTVTANVGIVNNGPATLDHERSGEPTSVTIVTAPPGTKVVGVPDGCFKSDDDSLKTPKGKGKTQYACFTDLVFPAKTRVTWPFKLQITAVTTNATGWVEVNPPCNCDRFSKDLVKSNDTAKIVANPGAAGQPGGGSGNGGTGGQGGGGLAITGPQAALYAGLGVVLVAAGVGGVLLARRRRTRFEA